MKKSLRKIFAAALVTGSLFAMPIANAEIKTYEGTDEYIMSEFETIDTAKQRAKQKAERAAQEKAGVFVESNTEVVNLKVTRDEVRTMTGGILKIIDVVYQLTPLSDGKSLIVRAIVKADIDSDDINKWLNRGMTERADVVAKNLELQKAIDEQDKQIAELKKKLADSEARGDKEKLSEQFAAEDKIFRSNQKLEEAMRFYYTGDLQNVASYCTQAIDLNPSNAAAYSIRGAAYYSLQNYNGAINDLNRAIDLNATDYKNFYNRGLAYVKLGDYRKAVADFSSAIKLNPNDADSWYNRGVCRQRLGDSYKAREDLKRAKSLGYR